MTVALFTTHLVRHLPPIGQVFGLLQLQVRGFPRAAGVRTLALWSLIMVAMLPIQL